MPTGFSCIIIIYVCHVVVTTNIFACNFWNFFIARKKYLTLIVINLIICRDNRDAPNTLQVSLDNRIQCHLAGVECRNLIGNLKMTLLVRLLHRVSLAQNLA